MDSILDQITVLLKNNIFLTPKIRSKIWERVREINSNEQQTTLKDLQAIDNLQRDIIRKILKKNPHFFKDIKREIYKKHLHAHLKQERHEHAKNLEKVEALLEKTLSEL